MPRAPPCSRKTTHRHHYRFVEETSGLFPRVQTTPRLPLVPYVTGNFSSFRTSTYYCCTTPSPGIVPTMRWLAQRKQLLRSTKYFVVSGFPGSVLICVLQVVDFFLGSRGLVELQKRVTRYRIYHSICVSYQQSKKEVLTLFDLVEPEGTERGCSWPFVP